MSTAEDKPAKVLDAKGLLCPMPVIKTSRAVKDVSVGQVLEVLTTDPGSKPDLDGWAKVTGNEILSVQEDEGSPKVFKFLIKRLK